MEGTTPMTVSQFSDHIDLAPTPTINSDLLEQGSFTFMLSCGELQNAGPNAARERLSNYCDSIGASWEFELLEGNRCIAIEFDFGEILICPFGRRSDFDAAIWFAREFLEGESSDEGMFGFLADERRVVIDSGALPAVAIELSGM